MCGIAGYSAGHEGGGRDLYESLARRGPDSRGFWSDEYLSLIHTRLAIVDPSPEANQPMVSQCGDYVLTYNGEIYNYKALRTKLVSSGWDFDTDSDTEVLLALLIELGGDALELLDGLFAFAFYSRAKGEILLGRDRYGGKPLYLSIDDHGFMFSSSLATFDLRLHSSNLNTDALCEYFHFSTTLSPNTLFQGISQIEPGCFSVLDINKKAITSTKRYYFPKMGRHKAFEREKLLSLLKTSCADQDPEYVKMALFLSGGLDSTGLAGFYSARQGSELHTITANFDQRNLDEVCLAESFAAEIQSSHTTININYQKTLETLISITKSFGQPIADAAVLPLTMLCKELPTDIRVIVQGDGGDEVFGGYRYYRRLYLSHIRYLLTPFAFLSQYFIRSIKLQRKLRTFYAITLYSGALRFARMYSNLLPWERVGKYVKIVVNEDAFARRYYELWAQSKNFWHAGSRLDVVNQNLLMDQMIILPDLYMRKSDIASMENSKEVRLPLLANKVVDELNLMRGVEKVSFLKTKVFLRNALQSVLPEFLLKAKKRGFSTPYGDWMRSRDFQCYFEENISKSRLLDPEAARELNAYHLAHNDAMSLRLWQVYCLLIWEMEVTLSGV